MNTSTMSALELKALAGELIELAAIVDVLTGDPGDILAAQLIDRLRAAGYVARLEDAARALRELATAGPAPAGHRAHADDPGSPETAAAAVTEAAEGTRLNPRPGSRCHRALAAYARAAAAELDGVGLTDTDIANVLGLPRNEAAKRCADLRSAGYVARTGDHMVTDGLRLEALCRITTAGLELLANLNTAGPLGDLTRKATS